MSPTYSPTLNSRERILIMGGPGAGKSYSAYQVARRVLEAGHDVWAFDNDFSFERMKELDPPVLGEGATIVHYELQPDEWSELMSGLEYAIEKADRDDLLIVDSMTPTWQAAQEFFTDQIFEKGIDEYFLDARKNLTGNKLDTYDGWKDWSVINKIYGKLYRLLNRFPGHVILTAEAEPLGPDADKDLKALLGPVRVKPRGQKALAHRVNTVVYVMQNRDGSREMRVAKDRGREIDVEGEPLDDFFRSYFVGRAGWMRA